MISSQSQSKNSGFTLIELLVVISIITLLASVVLTSLVQARRKGRDAKRLADMRQLQTALDLYYDQNASRYPDPDPNDATHASAQGLFCGGWDVSSYNPFISALRTAGVASKLAADPLNTNYPAGGSDCGGYAYRYYRYGPSSNCDPCNGKYFYVLGVNLFETVNFPHPGSPGWKCVNPASGAVFRDWQNEFSWVAGKCE